MARKTQTRRAVRSAQFDLRKFLLACLVTGALGGTTYSFTKDIIQTCQTVPIIESGGGIVYSDFVERYGLFPPHRKQPWGPLIEWGMAAPTEVYLGMRRGSQPKQLVAAIASLPEVRCIVLSTADIGNTDLSYLLRIRGLEEVRLAGTSIDDGGLCHLARLPSVKRLDLSFTGISDRGIQHFLAMPTLRELRIDNTRVTSAGLRFIREKCPHIQIHPSRWTEGLKELGIARHHHFELLHELPREM